MRTTHAFWAEAILGIDYQEPDTAHLARLHRRGLAVCASLCASVAAVVFVASQALYPAPYSTGITILEGLAPAPLPPAVVASAPTVPSDSAPVKASAAGVALNKRHPTPKQPLVGKGESTPKPLARSQNDKPNATLSKETAPDLKPDARSAAERAAERASKPVDIAPAEKLGIREVRADSITLINGVKVKMGSRLPNGEVLISIEPKQGLVETSHRVMMVSP
jgi:hypothetical protein